MKVFIKGLSLACILMLSAASQAFPSLYIRGSFNDWASMAMSQTEPGIWRASLNIQSNDQFKFDVYGDWSENYGDNNSDNIADLYGNNIVAGISGSVTITFDENLSQYSVVEENQQTQHWQRTVIFIYGRTNVGQDMFIRGGIDSNWSNANRQTQCGEVGGEHNEACSINIRHLNQFHETSAQWRIGDEFLDWGRLTPANNGREPHQNIPNPDGDYAFGTPAMWTTSNRDKDVIVYESDRNNSDVPNAPAVGVGFSELNQFGDHYWMLDVEMDCSQTVDGWFELKSYISNGPGWEPNVDQVEFGGLTPPPFAGNSINHIARCGKLNVFRRGDSSYEMSDLPDEQCAEVYPGHNDVHDLSRFNYVISSAGFNTVDEAIESAKRLLDLEGNLGEQNPGGFGFLQLPVIRDNADRFNFWVPAQTAPFSDYSKATVEEETENPASVLACQEMLGSRVIVLYNRPRVPESGSEGYIYGSYGRHRAFIADCLAPNSMECQNNENITFHRSNVHEMLHGFACIGDEYGWGGSDNENTVPWNGEPITTSQTEHLFLADSYEECINEAPWRDQIGQGCGDPNSTDCFQNTAECSVANTIQYDYGTHIKEQCCLPGMPCWNEVGCFEGGYGKDIGVWRPTMGSIMRNPYFNQFSPDDAVSPVMNSIHQRIFDKGPAIGKVWEPEGDYQLDCDVKTDQFVP